MKHKYLIFWSLIPLLLFPILGFSQNIDNQRSLRLRGNDIEQYIEKLKALNVMECVKEQTGATLRQMQLFQKYYKDSIEGADKNKFVRLVQRHLIENDEDIKQYADAKINHYVNLFKKFIEFTNEFPETVKEYLEPLTASRPPLVCNPACDNIDFEQGSLTAWTACYASNTSNSSFSQTANTCFGPLSTVTVAAFDPATSSNQVNLTSGPGFDPIAGPLIPVVCPTGGSYSCEVGDYTGYNDGIGVIEQTWMVTAATANLTYMYAVLLENPYHPYYQQPHFSIQLLDQNGVPIPGCGQYDVVSGPGLPGYTAIYYPADLDTVYALPWQVSFVPLQAYIGTCVTIIVTAYDCSQGGHFGYGYFDATCSPLGIITSSPSICGSSSVTLTGSAGCATYTWLGPCVTIADTTQTISVNCTGTFTCIVTSNIRSSCADTLTVTITSSPPLNFTLNSTTNILCNGGTTGSASATASGGTSPYTYSWSPISNSTSSVSGLSAGTYTAYARDAAGCLDSIVITITQPPLLTATTTATGTSCSGTGSAIVTAGGGTSPYTYSWSPVAGTSSTITGLSAGTYTITVTDANGCTQTATAIVTSTGGLSMTTSETNILCNGSATGNASATIIGGTSPFTYSWAPGGNTTSSISGLSAGTYTIYATDATGCNGVDSAIITQPPALTASMSSTATPCGGNTGTATVVAGGGTGAYTYSWYSVSGTNSTLTGLSAGNYSVTVTDANGCTVTGSAAVTSSGAGTITLTSVNDSCFGKTNATLTATINGGTAPYTYSWTPIGATTSTISNLSAGTYTITITDAAGCITIAVDTITQPPLLTDVISSINNITCFGANNGSIFTTASGGTPAYNYTWTPSGGTGANATGLSAGTYTLTVKDVNGCTATNSAVIMEPPALTATATSVDIGCHAVSGSVTVTAGGGSPVYTYLWSPPGASSSTVTGLTAGTYTVVVTDSKGCSITLTDTITATPGVSVNINPITNILCFGNNTGSATANASSGTTPYVYLWSPSAISSSSATGLNAGTYTVTVTDANGCTGTASAVITEPLLLKTTAVGPPNVCNGASAIIGANTTGGTGPYTYSWSPTAGNTDSITISPTTNTIYTVTVTDANGCTASSILSVVVDAPLSIMLTGDTTACPGQNIYLFVSGAGGDGVYSYKWVPSNSSTQWVTFILNNDTTVTVQLTDGCGAILTRNIHINVAPAPVIAFNSNPDIGCYPLCVQFRDLSTIVSGSVTSWDWHFGDGDSSHSKDPVHCYNDTGHFTVVLTAASNNGCSSTLKELNLITVYPHPVANFIYTPNPINIMSPTVQFIDRSTWVYPIQWWWWKFDDGSSVDVDENPVHTFSDTGLFCAHLEIMDIHGCTDSTTNCFDVEPQFTFYIPDAFTPNGDGINDVFQPKGSYIKSYEMYIFDRWGERLYHTDDFYTGWNGEVNNAGQPCQEDTYVYLIYVYDTKGNKHTYTGKVNLIR